MEKEIKLRAGVPDDKNRDYLPESIYHSKIVVNENGNNSQPYPERLQEFHEELVEKGKEDVWFEYAPEVYDGKTKVPLIISLHGGLMTGWGQAIYSTWTMVADRDNCIVFFPNASSRKMWLVEYSAKDLANKAIADEPEELHAEVPPDDPNENHDMQLILHLIERAKEKYNIDEGRIFIQGMSAGNLMSSYFSRYFGDRITGLGESAGPTFDPAHCTISQDLWLYGRRGRRETAFRISAHIQTLSFIATTESTGLRLTDAIPCLKSQFRERIITLFMREKARLLCISM